MIWLAFLQGSFRETLTVHNVQDPKDVEQVVVKAEVVKTATFLVKARPPRCPVTSFTIGRVMPLLRQLGQPILRRGHTGIEERIHAVSPGGRLHAVFHVWAISCLSLGVPPRCFTAFSPRPQTPSLDFGACLLNKPSNLQLRLVLINLARGARRFSLSCAPGLKLADGSPAPCTAKVGLSDGRKVASGR